MTQTIKNVPRGTKEKNIFRVLESSTWNKRNTVCVILFVSLLMTASCAKILAPSGGARDVAEPRVQKATPENKSIKFKEKSIEIVFNEYVKIENPQNIIINPEITPRPNIKTNKNKIIISNLAGIKDSTTYSINFGNTISDYTENNIAKNISYVFNTGDVLDSLYIDGIVINANGYVPLKKATVALYKAFGDSISLNKPIGITFADTAGVFIFNNLSKGIYDIIAYNDKNKNRAYDENEEVGISTLAVESGNANQNIVIKAALNENKKNIKSAKFNTNESITIVSKYSLDNKTILNNEALNATKIVENTSKDSAIIWLPNFVGDSLAITFNSNNKSDTVNIGRRLETKRKINKPVISLNTTAKKLTPNQELKILSNIYIKALNKDSITIEEDSTLLTNVSMVQNEKYITINYKWKIGKTYFVSIKKGFITSISDSTNDKYTNNFKIEDVENLGIINLKVNTGNDYNNILELRKSNGEVIYKTTFKNKLETKIENLIVDKYTISLITDENNNNKWDAGNIYTRKQAENIKYYKENINLRANWEVELNWLLDK